MNAIPLKTILGSVAQLAGVSSRQISPEQQSAMVVAVSEALRLVWEEYPWPDTMTTLEAWLWPTAYNPASGTTYTAGTIVRFGESFWEVTKPFTDPDATIGDATVGVISAIDVLTANFRVVTFTTAPDAEEGDIIYKPGDPTATTTVLAVDGKTITVAETWTLAVSNSVLRAIRPEENDEYFKAAVFDTYTTASASTYKVHEVYGADPRIGVAPRLDYELEGDKIRVPEGYARVWMEAQSTPPVLDGTEWTATESVTAGMVRYSTTGGDCFKCIANKAGNVANTAPETDTATWTRIQIPALFATAVRYYASADLLRADGKETTAIARENKGNAALESALQGVNNHQHQTRRYRVRVA
jgi:hypothetical protein